MNTLPADPEGMNDERANWAEHAIQKFIEITGTDKEDALTDLLANLMHWADRNGADFKQALMMAEMHYEAETSDDASGDE